MPKHAAHQVLLFNCLDNWGLVQKEIKNWSEYKN